MSEKTPEQFVKEFLDENSKSLVSSDGAFCTNFVLATEFVDANGVFYTYVVKDESMPGWRHEGLLHYVIANELYSTDTDENEDGDF